MSRTLAIGDVHGGYRALKQVLARAGATQDDLLVFLGDYLDGWSEGPRVLDYLQELEQSHRCIFLIGNHEELALAWLREGIADERWLMHGGKPTIAAYEKEDDATRARHIAFIESLQDYYIDDSNRLFVHAGFGHIKGVKYEYFPRNVRWDRTLWEMVLALDPTLSPDDKRYPARLKNYAEIFVGHTPTVRIGSTEPVNAANVWNLDTGAAFNGPLTVMDVETKQFWQSDPVYTLYSDEQARKAW